MGQWGAAHLHQLEEDATPAEDKGSQKVRAGVETGQVAEQRLQVGAKPGLRVLAQTSVICGQTVTQETHSLTLILRNFLYLCISVFQHKPAATLFIISVVLT